MTIRFTKGIRNLDTLTCLRDDGSCTWSPSSVGTPHDLIHYAVETTLGCKNAFYGLIAQGRNIAEFGTRDGRKDVYPVEALWAECLVGFLQTELRSGARFSVTDFEDMRSRQFPELPPDRDLTEDVLDRLRQTVCAYLDRWNALPAGAAMDLVFPTEPVYVT